MVKTIKQESVNRQIREANKFQNANQLTARELYYLKKQNLYTFNNLLSEYTDYASVKRLIITGIDRNYEESYEPLSSTDIESIAKQKFKEQQFEKTKSKTIWNNMFHGINVWTQYGNEEVYLKKGQISNYAQVGLNILASSFCENQIFDMKNDSIERIEPILTQIVQNLWMFFQGNMYNETFTEIIDFPKIRIAFDLVYQISEKNKQYLFDWYRVDFFDDFTLLEQAIIKILSGVENIVYYQRHYADDFDNANFELIMIRPIVCLESQFFEKYKSYRNGLYLVYK
jgi:hypothetical protein